MIMYVWKFLEYEVHLTPHIRTRTSDRRGRACITSHVGVISDVSGRVIVQLSSCALPGNQYKRVCSHIWTIFRIIRII